MKLVYINGPYHGLPYSRSSRSPAVTKSGTIYYPLWLAYAAGVARDKLQAIGQSIGDDTDGYQIEVLDAVARKWCRDELITHLRTGSGPDLVFCDTSTPSIHEDIATAGAIKEAFPKCHVVLVGTHATALPEEVLNADRRIDAVIRGEFDITAVELARAIRQGRDWQGVNGLSIRCGNEIEHTAARELISNLDELPFVSEIYRDFLNVEDYFFAAAQFPMVMIITSRGCPHHCKWCLYPQVMHQGKYRLRSSENVAAEFAFISETMPQVREIGIEDDLFTGNKKRLREICRLLIQQNNRLNFWCDTRVDLDYETMRLMKAAGCRMLIAGFESADQGILDGIAKGTQKEQAFTFMRDARRADLLVHGCFVVGNPGETVQTMRQTLDFAKKLGPDTAQFFPMIVYPGTAMYNWAKENNYLRSEDYNQWLSPAGMHNSMVDLPGLKAEEVVGFCNHARREFYLRGSYLFHKLAQSFTNVHEAKRNIKALRTFAQHLVRSA